MSVHKDPLKITDFSVTNYLYTLVLTQSGDIFWSLWYLSKDSHSALEKLYIPKWQIRVVHHVLWKDKWAPVLKFLFSLLPYLVPTWTDCFIRLHSCPLNIDQNLIHYIYRYVLVPTHQNSLFLPSLPMIPHDPDAWHFCSLWQIICLQNFNLIITFSFKTKIVFQWLVNGHKPITKVSWVQSSNISM